MMNAQEKMTDLDPDVVLLLKLFAPRSNQNVLTIYSDGRATFQAGFGAKDREFKLDLGGKTVGEYLERHLPVEAFLSLQEHYYDIPSDRTCGTAANLYLRIGKRENWVGIWNYGRGEIPASTDANMFKGVLKLVEYLSEG